MKKTPTFGHLDKTHLAKKLKPPHAILKQPARTKTTMPLYAEVCVAFALPIALPEGFDGRMLSALMDNLNTYEPTSPASAEGSVKKARLASIFVDIFEMDQHKEYPMLKYHDVVECYNFEGPLTKAFETAATKILGNDHGVSVVLQERFGDEDVEDGTPRFSMYLVDKATMLTPGDDVEYDEIHIPCVWYRGLDFTDIPIDQVDAVKTKEHFERLCRALGLEKNGNAGWKLIASVGEKSNWEKYGM